MVLNLPQLLLPKSGQLGTFEQLLLDDRDKLHPRRRSHNRFALAANVLASEQRLDDGGACRRTSDAVLLHCVAQFLVVHSASRRLHGAQQRGLGVRFGRLRHFLCQVGQVRSALALYKVGQCALRFVLFVVIIVGGGSHFGGRWRYGAPARLQYDFACGLKRHVGSLPHDGGGGKLAVGVEHRDEAACHQVVHVALGVGQIVSLDAGRYDGVVVGHLARVEHLFAFGQHPVVAA